jgi:dihydroflavonol-4-reductase
MKVFLTGGTGLLGNNLARRLSQRGDSVVALVRQPPQPEVFEGTDAELVVGDLDSHDVIEDAIRQCDAVIHSAAMIHIGWQRLDESIRINRDGSAAIARSARRHGKRMVHISTVNTLALPDQRRHGGVVPTANEDTPITPASAQLPCAYVTSKIESVRVVKEEIAQGLDATIVHPGFMLGPWDWKPSSGRMILELGRRYVPASPTGGCSVCDVRDVAAGVLSAMDRGQTGRHYILAGENWLYRKLWQEIARRMGRPKPIFPLGPLMRGGVAAYGYMQRLRGRDESDVNSAALKITSQWLWYDSSRARDELGYTNRDVHETLDDATAWIKRRFMAG